MRHAVATLLGLLVLALPSAPAGAAVPVEETLSVTVRQQAEDRDHPGSHLLPLPVSRPFHQGARVCARYENDVFQFGNRGRARLVVGLWRGGRRIAELDFGSRRVRINRIDFGCLEVARLRGGDTLLYDFRFSNMPRLAPRSFSHGGVVNTSMWVAASVEPPPPAEASTIELLAVEPPLGSRVAGGSRIRVRVRYSCAHALGCNVSAGFTDNGTREVVRGVRQGSRSRTLVLRCHESRADLVMGGLRVGIERSRLRPLAGDSVAGEITCAGSGFD